MVFYIRVLSVKVNSNESFSLFLTSSEPILNFSLEPLKTSARSFLKTESERKNAKTWLRNSIKFFLFRTKKVELNWIPQFSVYLLFFVRFNCVFVFPGKSTPQNLKRIFVRELSNCLPAFLSKKYIYERFMSIKVFTFHICWLQQQLFHATEICVTTWKHIEREEKLFLLLYFYSFDFLFAEINLLFPAVLPMWCLFLLTQKEKLFEAFVFGF